MKLRWQKLLAREGVDILTISGLDVVFFESIWRYTRKRGQYFFTLVEGKNFVHYIAVDPQEVGRMLYRKLFSSPREIQKHYQRGKDLLREAKIPAREIEKHSLLESFEVFRRQFMEVNHVFSIESWIGLEAWQHDFETLLNKLIAKQGLEKNQGIITDAISRPWKETALGKIQKALYQKKSVATLVTRFQFLRSWSAVWYRPLDATWFKNVPTVVSRKGIPTRKQAIDKLQPSKKERHFLENASYNIFFKDWRDDLRREFVYIWSPLFDRIAREFRIDRDLLGLLTLDELEKALQRNSIDRGLIASRRKKQIIVASRGQSLIMKVVEENLQKFQKYIVSSEKTDLQAEIRGIVAYRARVQGRVVVLHSYHDVKKVQNGDVLVANTTHPNYLPAMKKAVAFVTNEGGIISHAAIVAREMKKPCIVGTKFATKVLKDGDMVEVDAEKGIVRKLS